MKDICTDYCESTVCTNCRYRKATKEEKIKAYEELSKCRTFVCPLRCNAIESDCKGIHCSRYMDYSKGYNDCRMDILSEQLK